MTESTSLYVPADAKGLAALTREWVGARVTVLVGLVIAIGFVGWLTYSNRPMATDFSAGGFADGDTGQDQMDQSIAAGASKEGFMLCRLAIGVAENYGVLPGTMKYTGGPAKTDVAGRYVCQAEDKGGARFTMTADLLCRDLNNANCASLVQVAKADGAVIYHRQEVGADAAPAPAPDTSAPPEPDTTVAPDTSGATAPPDATGGTAPDPTAPPQ